MSAGSSGAESGAVLGAVVVFLLQQLGYLSLSTLVPALEWLIVGVIVFGVFGGIVGAILGRRRSR
ncbi:MAG TPA: hypothetical protein VMG36_06150 [Thermoplasmata archaeon]|nr:hypothetical protein [Thermoplasmata archaeon]